MKVCANEKFPVIVCFFVFLAVMMSGQESALAEPGDVTGPDEVPDGWVTFDDLLYGINFLIGNSPPPPAKCRVPVIGGISDLDIADANGQGLVGIGDGWIDAGDINFLVEVMSTWEMCEKEVPALPSSYVSPTAGAEIDITVNGEPWDQVSPVCPNDVIGVAWVGTDSAGWMGGFCNFTLNVSKGEYLNDLEKNPFFGTWYFDRFTVTPDGQGGINVGNVGGDASFVGGGGCGGPYAGSIEIFSFSFRIPDVNGPAYTIDVRPTQGSWRLIMYNQLPCVQLQVSRRGPAVCVNPPQYDLNDDCKVDFRDLALLASEWLFCGYDVPSACVE